MAAVSKGDSIPAVVADNTPPTATTTTTAITTTNPASAGPLSPTPEWEVDSIPLKDFGSKKHVPGFGKIVKGNYMNLGPSKFSFQRQHCEVFVHSVKMSVKVLAHCLKRIDNATVTTKSPKGGGNMAYSTTRVYAIDQRLAIPITYQGWFELLSEDGKSARPITSVHELCKVNPEKVLVRENIKAYIQNEDGKMTFDSSKIVIAGEQLVLCGELSLPTNSEHRKVKLLRCFDSKGEQLYLSCDQKGTFTKIAGDNDFTGVFSIRDVVRRFRLPLTVRLVQGVRPKVDSSKFTGLVRLDWVYTDETAFVCPIEKNHVRLLPIPVDVNLQLVSANNQTAMKSTQLYNNMLLKCNRMISNYNNTVHLIVNLPDAAAKGKGKVNSNIFSTPFSQEGGRPKTSKAKVKEERLMNEIDDLYGYVREGGPPPKFQYDSDEESYFEEPAYEPLDDFRARLRAMDAGEKVTHHSKYKPEDISTLALELDPERIDDENPYGVLNGKKVVTVVSGKTRPAPPLPLSRTSSGSANSNKSPSLGQNGVTSSSPPVAPDVPPPVPPRNYNSEQDKPEMYFTTVTSSGVIASHRTSPVTPVTTNNNNQSSQSSNTPLRPQSLNQIDNHNNSNYISSSNNINSKPPPRPAKSSPAPPLPPHVAIGRPRLMSRGSHDSINSNSGSSGGKRHGKLLGRDFKDSDISSMTKTSSGSSSGARKPSARKKMQTLYL